MESPSVTKIGAAIRDDLKGLQKLRHFTPKGFIDLQSIVGQYGITDLSLRKWQPSPCKSKYRKLSA